MKNHTKTVNLWPFLQWLPTIVTNLRADFLAGLTVALLLIPQSMAYAELAGMPAYYGLYASFIPVIIGALFGSLHQLGTGPVAMTSILVASILGSYAQQGSDKYIQLAILLALVVGVIRLLFGLLRLAFLVNFISHPVVAGFTNAGALIIGLSQLNKVFGLEMAGSLSFLGFLKDICVMLGNIGQSHLPSVCFGIGTMVVMYACKKWVPKIPGMLVAVIISITVSELLSFSGAIVGTIPKGLPSFGMLAWSWPGSEESSMLTMALGMIPGALMVSLIGFMEVLAVSKAISLKTKQPLNLNQELVGQGVSAIAGSFAQSFPTSGSFSRTALNLLSGGRSGMSSVFTGVIVLIVLLFFTPLLQALPKATLAGGIIMSVVGLIDFGPIKRAFHVSRRDAYIAIFTFCITLAFAPSIVNGVIVGAAISLLLYLPRMGKLKLCSEKGSDEILTVGVEGHLYFANYHKLESLITKSIVEQPTLQELQIDTAQLKTMDASAEWGLHQLQKQLRDSGIELRV